MNFKNEQHIKQTQQATTNKKSKLPQQNNHWEMSAQDALRVNYLTYSSSF